MKERCDGEQAARGASKLPYEGAWYRITPDLSGSTDMIDTLYSLLRVASCRRVTSWLEVASFFLELYPSLLIKVVECIVQPISKLPLSIHLRRTR
jgi:hypothetical protein